MTCKGTVSDNGKGTNKEKTNVFKEDLENTTRLFVDETRNTLDTTTTGETTNSGLGDT